MIEEHLYEYLRGELPEQLRKTIEAHLSSCKRCAAELESVRETISLMDTGLERPSAHRTELYWQHFAGKVERRIERDDRATNEDSILKRFLDSFVDHRKPFSIGFASALTLVMIAFGIWTVWIKNPASQTTTAEQPAQQLASSDPSRIQKAALDLRAQDYLEQSKVLLIGLMNTDTKTLGAFGTSLQREQEISRTLVSESGDLTSKLNDPSQRRMKELISDLQLILVQIANLGSKHALPGVEIIKGGIEHNDILFKINLEEIQRSAKTTPKPNTSAKRTI